MKKTIYTLNIDNYAPEITELTYPLLKRYAHRIGADFCVITGRAFPGWPVTYEKLQIFKLAQTRGDDWSIYIDSDAIVHPDFFDVTDFLPRDTVAHNGVDAAHSRWRFDAYFRRDGRNISSCNWFAVASSWCVDLWRPLELSLESALDNIYPLQGEVNSGVITPEHLIDDYALSRNIARFGLKVKTILQLQKDLGDEGNFLWHEYTIPVAQKVTKMREVLKAWKLRDAE